MGKNTSLQKGLKSNMKRNYFSHIQRNLITSLLPLEVKNLTNSHARGLYFKYCICLQGYHNFCNLFFVPSWSQNETFLLIIIYSGGIFRNTYRHSGFCVLLVTFENPKYFWETDCTCKDHVSWCHIILLLSTEQYLCFPW